MREHRRIEQFEKVCMISDKELQNYIYTMTRRDQFAMEEIYQNTMLGALKGLKYLRDGSKMKAWIFSIAKAESCRYYAARKQALHDDELAMKGVPARSNLLDFTKKIEDQEYVINLIRSLSSEERKLYILHYYYDLPLKEISGIMRANYSTVRSMHTRGMMKMRKFLRQEEEAHG